MNFKKLNKLIKLTGLDGRSRKNQQTNETEFEPLRNHVINVTILTVKFCKKFKAKNWGYVSGLFHDFGKIPEAFQNRIHGLTKESHDHPAYGAQYLFKKYGGYVGQAIAFIICGHHGGIPNRYTGQSGKSSEEKTYESLEQRLKKDLEAIPPKHINEFKKISLPRLRLPKSSYEKFLFIKMIFSCLVDADRLDAEAYGSPEKSKLRGQYDSLKILHKRLEEHLKTFENKPNPSSVDIIRTQVQKETRKQAWSWLDPRTWRRGVHSMTVPTGGGKTLASMLFALSQAIHLGFDRIIYVIPYTSIIEQNAAVFRKIFGEKNVIEHHCNFEKNKVTEKIQHYLATENWDAPIIVTTNVQFFESLYSNMASRNRRIHNTINSFIVFDESHLLPARVLKPCIRIIKALVENYRCSVLFCTATQTGLLKQKGLPWAFDNIHEIISDPQTLYKKLERVKYEYRQSITHDKQLVKLIEKFDQVLCVLNIRKHTRLIYEDTKHLEGIYHLSTLMCAAHRKAVFAEIKDRLSKGLICRAISTQGAWIETMAPDFDHQKT